MELNKEQQILLDALTRMLEEDAPKYNTTEAELIEILTANTEIEETTEGQEVNQLKIALKDNIKRCLDPNTTEEERYFLFYINRVEINKRLNN